MGLAGEPSEMRGDQMRQALTLSFISLMSAPAANALVLPVRTTAPMLLSLVCWLSAWLSSVKSAELSAAHVEPRPDRRMPKPTCGGAGG